MELPSWSAARDRAGRLWANQDWPGLWQHVLSLSVPQAAQHQSLGEWRQSDDADRWLARLLIGADHRMMAGVIDSVLSRHGLRRGDILVAAATQGRLAVREARLFPVGRADQEARHPTVIHDLDHPLNALARPARSLTSGDGAVNTAYQMSLQQEDVMGVVRQVAALRPAVPEEAGSGMGTALVGPDRRKSWTRWWSG